MSSNAVAVAESQAIDISVVEAVITGGDLGRLSPEQRVRYYIQTCEDLKLNWRTKPFDVVSLRGNGPKILYPNKGCAEQLAGIHNINVDLLEAITEQGVRIQKAKACLPNGRCTTSTGAVPVENLRGEGYANAVMKAETKARRRAILALVGLNMPDASELDTIPGSIMFNVDVETGEIQDAPETRQNAPQRTEQVSNRANDVEPTPIAAGNKITHGQVHRIADLFDELDYPNDQRRPFIAQLVGKSDPAKLTKAQGDKVIAALEKEFNEKFEYVGHGGVEWRERNPKPQVIEVEVIDENEIDWDAAKPEGMSQQDWDELMDPAAAGKDGDRWTRS